VVENLRGRAFARDERPVVKSWPGRGGFELRVQREAFLIVSGCTLLSWVLAAASQSGASIVDVAAGAINALSTIAGVLVGAVAVARSQFGIWGIDRAASVLHAAVVGLAGLVAEASDIALTAVGVAVDPSAGTLPHEILQAVMFSGFLWGTYLAATRMLRFASAPTPSATARADDPPLPAPTPVEISSGATTPGVPSVLRSAANEAAIESLEAIKAEGNYVKLLGADVSDLILYRFSQAVEEMADVGIQVHRSYWVRRSAVRDMQRSGKTGRLLLKSGREIPVSAPYLAAAQSLLQTRPPKSGARD
jgi:hypothetical protein